MNQHPHPRHNDHRFRRQSAVQRGVTLVEAACALTVSALLVVASIPGFEAWRQSRQMVAALAELQTNVQLARSEAVLRGTAVNLRLMPTSQGSCYIVHSGRPGDCECDAAGQSRCVVGATAIRSVGMPLAARLRWSSNSSQLQFDPSHGTVTPTATLRLVGEAGRELRAVINIRGRVRTCSALSGFGGYKTC
jgi:type IV fimbrial biogenesis protein FimT